MPTYQYACTDPACDHRFEQFQSFTDDALNECPVCSSRLRKVYGSVGVVFKGSGFYRNDSREEANGTKKKGSDKDSASSATNSTNGKDTSSTTDSSSSSGSTDSSTAASTNKPATKAETSSSGSSGNSKS